MEYNGKVYKVLEDGREQHRNCITYFAARNLARELSVFGGRNTTIMNTITGEEERYY